MYRYPTALIWLAVLALIMLLVISQVALGTVERP
jgi:hypothetical protein